MSKTALVEIRNTITTMEPEFRAALPAHIPSAKFIRTAQTALQMNPDIVDCDRRSIYGAIMKAAQDGLVLDGREAALVKFGTAAQYMPMVAGLMKKARNSGDISTIAAHVVYQNDTFTYELGDDERIIHKPYLTGDRGKPILVYAVATLKDGGKQRAIMTVAEIERVRAVSRAKNGPAWSQWWDEMAKKTVIRRLSKYLPSSTDKDEEFHRTVQADDELYKEEPASTPAQEEPAAPARRRTRASAVIDAQAVEIEEPPPPPEPEPEPARASEEMDLI